MKKLAERRANYEKVSKRIEELGNEGVEALMKEAIQVHFRIGGTAVKLEIAGVPIFAKQIAVCDLEMEHPGSTANLFNLPTYYQYGVGSAGFGAWRELEAHKMTTDWVLRNECPNFPLMYGYAILPRAIDELTGSELEKEEKIEKREKSFEEIKKYWGGSEAIDKRLRAIDCATKNVVVFMESIPQTLDSYIHPQASEGDLVKPDMLMVERDLKSVTAFMESKGMIHFDVHGQNVLTDGEQIYVADFGLATSLDFELSAEEREFFEKNLGYDRSIATSCLCNHPRAESGEELPILPEVQEVSNRYKQVSEKYRAFMESLRKDFTKTTPYPAKEMQALHQKIDSEEKVANQKSFVEKLDLKKPDEKQR